MRPPRTCRDRAMYLRATRSPGVNSCHSPILTRQPSTLERRASYTNRHRVSPTLCGFFDTGHRTNGQIRARVDDCRCAATIGAMLDGAAHRRRLRGADPRRAAPSTAKGAQASCRGRESTLPLGDAPGPLWRHAKPGHASEMRQAASRYCPTRCGQGFSLRGWQGEGCEAQAVRGCSGRSRRLSCYRHPSRRPSVLAQALATALFQCAPGQAVARTGAPRG